MRSRPCREHNATCRRPSRLAGKCRIECSSAADPAASRGLVLSLRPLRRISASGPRLADFLPPPTALPCRYRLRCGEDKAAKAEQLGLGFPPSCSAPCPHPPPRPPSLRTPLSRYLSRFPRKLELVRFWFPREARGKADWREEKKTKQNPLSTLTQLRLLLTGISCQAVAKERARTVRNEDNNKAKNAARDQWLQSRRHL